MKSIVLRKIALWLVLFSIGTSGYSQWTQKASYIGARDASVSWLIGGKFYLVGGNGKSDVQEYDPANNTWTTKASIPQGAIGFGMGFVINGKGYVCGGVNASFQYTGTLLEYDPVTNQWATRAPLPGGKKVANGLGFAVGNKGYIGCGDDGVFVNADIFEYDPLTDSWAQKQQFNGGFRSFPYCFTIGDTAYVGGGGAGSTTTQYNDLWEYDQASDNWVQKTPLPGAPRQACASFASPTKGYVALGQSSYSLTFKQVFVYDKSSDTWDSIPKFTPGGRAWPVGFCYNDDVYIAGGWNFSTFYRDLYVYSTKTVSTVGLDKNKEASFSVYPNPANENLTISFHKNSNANIELMDVMGKIVFSKSIEGNTETTIPFRLLPAGVYFIKVDTEGRIQTSKVIHVSN